MTHTELEGLMKIIKAACDPLHERIKALEKTVAELRAEVQRRTD